MPLKILPLFFVAISLFADKRIKTCEIQAVPYFYTGNAAFSGRACAAMTLSTILNPEVITVRDLNIEGTYHEDDPLSLKTLYDCLGADNFHWDIVKNFEEIKSHIKQGHLVTIEGILGSQHVRFEQSTNKVLVIGFDNWGLIVHDPCGKWLGYKERAYSHAPQDHREAFQGKRSLYLFRDLQKLLEDGALFSWTTAWMNNDNVEIIDDFEE